LIRRFLYSWAFNVAALFVASWVVGGISYGDRALALIAAGLVFSLVNLLVKPIVTILSLPLILITLGVAYFFVNILMLYITDWIVDDFEMDGFGAAVAGTIIVWLVNVLLEMTLGRAKDED
jgi:putative membrane protein